MSEFIFKKGNTGVIRMAIKDQDGVTVSTLAAATELTFELKKTETGLAIFTLTKTGGEIAVNTPDTGDVQITISPTNMGQVPKRYYCALKITWSATEIYEVHIFIDGVETESFKIEQNIVS